MKPSQTVTQNDGKIITFFTENKLWKAAYADGSSSWEKKNWQYTQLLVKNPNVVLDIGANIGQETVYYSDWAKKVYAFEPAQSTFECLEKNVQQNNLKNVVLHRLGVSNSANKALINLVKGNEGRSFVTDKPNKNTQEIELIVLDNFELHGLNDEKIDFVKMDVEGFEINALEGMKGLIDKHSPTFMIEAQDSNLFRCGATSVDIWDFFDSRGYEATINTGRKIVRSQAPTKNRHRVDLFFKKTS